MDKTKKILVTGGSGFIGTNFIKYVLKSCPSWNVVNLDALTYAGHPANHATADDDSYQFVRGNITDSELLKKLFATHSFQAVFHFAAESHVDRSIADPGLFIETNITGTFRLLEAALTHFRDNPDFRFVHVSTDEVYGSLELDSPAFAETTPYDPSSPYSASKAASDHLVQAYHRTYGLPTLITNCSNNYGPYQFPEKLIPLMIVNILDNQPLPIYGQGTNIRDWLYVADHCQALATVFEKGVPGQTYNIGGKEEKKNIEVVETICDIMDQRLERTSPARDLITFVTDRPGHDLRYAIDSSKIEQHLQWQAAYSFDQALSETIDWYLDNLEWVRAVQSGEYKQWIKKHYNS